MEHFNSREQAIKNKVSSIIAVLNKGDSEENIKEAYKILIDHPKE